MKRLDTNRPSTNGLPWLRRLCLAAAALGATSLGAQSTYETVPFRIDAVNERIIPADMDGDSLPDLLVSDKGTMSLYLQDAAGFDFSSPDAVLKLPGTATGWDLDYLSGNSLQTTTQRRLVAVVDGRQIVAWEFDAGAFKAPQVLVEAVDGFMPQGFFPVYFVADVNGDGYSDFLVPGANAVSLHLGSATGYQQQGRTMAVQVNQNSNLWSQGNLQSRIGGNISVGGFRRRDINNDGLEDIIFSKEDGTDLFLASANGSYPEAPSMESAVQRDVRVNFDDIISSLDNLSRFTNLINFDYFHDVDNDGIDDYIVKEENKVSFYLGSASGFNLDKPDQVLKSAGNMILPALFDEDGDGLDDLVLVRIEDISAGDLILKAVLASSIRVEAFVYRNRSGDSKGFASRPHRKLTVAFAIPAFIKLPGIIASIEERAATRTQVASLDADLKADDILVLRENVIEAYKNISVFDDRDLADILNRALGLRKDKDDYRLDVLDFVDLTGNLNLLLLKDRKPDLLIPIAAGNAGLDLRVADFNLVDMNNDQRDDIFVFTDRTPTSVTGYLLLSQ